MTDEEAIATSLEKGLVLMRGRDARFGISAIASFTKSDREQDELDFDVELPI